MSQQLNSTFEVKIESRKMEKKMESKIDFQNLIVRLVLPEKLKKKGNTVKGPNHVRFVRSSLIIL